MKKDAVQKHGKLASWQQIKNEKTVTTLTAPANNKMKPTPKVFLEITENPTVGSVNPQVTETNTTVETFNDITPIVEAETIPTKKFAKKKVEE